MATGQTAAEPREGPGNNEVTDATAERHDRALAVVQRLLRDRRVRAYAVHTISLKLSGDGRPFPRGEHKRYVPELVAYSDAGRMVATVAVGPRTGCYLVSRNGIGLQPVRGPQQVVDLILSDCSGAGSWRCGRFSSSM